VGLAYQGNEVGFAVHIQMNAEEGHALKTWIIMEIPNTAIHLWHKLQEPHSYHNSGGATKAERLGLQNIDADDIEFVLRNM